MTDNTESQAADTGLEEAMASMKSTAVEELQSEDQKRLLDAIDSLRAQGLGDRLPLPQLIVCGGQSTGKSSVLEAISGVPFPRGESLCTRFASEIVLRRCPETSIEVEILADKNRPDAEKKRLHEFSRKLDSFAAFPALIDEVKGLMGLRTSPEESGRAFSRDVLRVYYQGPNQPHLTIVDLPGLIHTTTDTQNNGDLQMVEELIRSYMSNSNSIILAVVTATTDWENQVILEHAKRLDPEGARTLGIVTKLDRVRKGSQDEKKWLKLVQNKSRVLDLGWHVVKNIDTGEQGFSMTSEQRDEQEMSFFETSPFQSDVISKLGVGIEALRERLSHVLLKKIQSSMSPLLDEVDDQIHECNTQLNKLGEGRPSLLEQRSYLGRISQSFYTIARDAIHGNYVSHDILREDDKKHLRLCAVTRDLHDGFGRSMDMAKKWNLNDNSSRKQQVANEYGAMIGISPQEEIEMARKLIVNNRGQELPGQPNKEAIHKLFIEYTEPWAEVARRHVYDVKQQIEDFVEEVLEHLTDEYTAFNIHNVWLRGELERNATEGFNELSKLLKVHRHSPLTLNPNFIRETEYIRRQANEQQQPDNANASPSDAAANECLRVMDAYYRIALDIFRDNVPSLAIWLPLLYPLPETFSPERVASMDDDLVRSLASEPPEVVARRTQLRKDLEHLTRGREEICRQVTGHRLGKSPRRPRLSAHVPSSPHPMADSSPESVTRSYSPSSKGGSTGNTTPSPSPWHRGKAPAAKAPPFVQTVQPPPPQENTEAVTAVKMFFDSKPSPGTTAPISFFGSQATMGSTSGEVFPSPVELQNTKSPFGSPVAAPEMESNDGDLSAKSTPSLGDRARRTRRPIRW